MTFYPLPTPQAVQNATDLIAREVLHTPVRTSAVLSDLTTSNLDGLDTELFFKCENFQHTGSFKFRGAMHFLARLPNHELLKGIVAYSTGNHALAVARAAQILSKERHIEIPTFVVVPQDCSPIKVSAAKHYGATILFCEPEPEARKHLAQKLAKRIGAVVVPPADHENIALGQATLVREFLDQVHETGVSLDAVIVPSGGGGLLVGAIAACKPSNTLVFGAEPILGGPGLRRAMEVGVRATTLTPSDTMADGLRSLTGEANFEIIKRRDNVNGIFSVSEDQIRDSLRLVVNELGFVVEPSAAVPLAVALFSPEFKDKLKDESMKRRKEKVRIGIVLTGSNITEEDLATILPDL
ncbi:tryptophan synthase beta subunit-like PLP-dependent enzyme [Dendryphion nanum]|uniref:Tryptophan synthase beta subunit-like PLP-dependent enzyme n=1 Tax=Dendryphion nanum TaxID=256645 RepID=A0A9P9EJP9_9PLEO|nr:tryptophan synthase beta subunit-like PLP-dependent enzyme [Dendryphion nanum]